MAACQAGSLRQKGYTGVPREDVKALRLRSTVAYHTQNFRKSSKINIKRTPHNQHDEMQQYRAEKTFKVGYLDASSSSSAFIRGNLPRIQNKATATALCRSQCWVKQRVLRTDLWRMFPTCIPDSGSMYNCDTDNPCIQTGIVFRSACFKCGAASFNITVYICIAGCSALVISSYFIRDDIPVVGKHRNCFSPIRKKITCNFLGNSIPFSWNFANCSATV